MRVTVVVEDSGQRVLGVRHAGDIVVNDRDCDHVKVFIAIVRHFQIAWGDGSRGVAGVVGGDGERDVVLVRIANVHVVIDARDGDGLRGAVVA